MRGDGNKRKGALKALRRSLRWAAPFAVACALASSGALGPIERTLIDWRFRLIERAPTDSLVLVEIDPLSLKADKTWPWSRARYAQAIDNLKRAGARSIGIDIDFSAQSDAAGDEALARSLEKWPGEVVLARFSQGSAVGRQRRAMIETAPDERFLASTVVASANFELEEDGLVRRGMSGAMLPDGYRASMAVTLAAKPYGTASTFLIDYSIDPYKIRRLSFADVLAKGFDPNAVAGRHVLIGASAIELGDEFVVPKYGLLPGVWLHALSYESLVQDRALVRSGPVVSLGLALLVAVALGRRPRRWSWTGHLPHAAFLIGLLALPLAAQAAWPVSIDTAPALVVHLMCVLASISGELEGRAREILQQRRSIASHQSLMALVVGHSSDGVVVADAEGRLQSCNQRAGELLGFDPPLASGRSLAAFHPDFPVLSVGGQESEAQAPTRSEYVVPGSDIVLEILCERVEEANGHASRAEETRFIYVYWLRDITTRKRLEAAEKSALEAARESSLAKTQLIANMSHELRTPLNAVIGFADLFTRQIFGPLGNEQYATYAQHILESGQRLLAVVNDVLEVAHLDSGRVVLDPQGTELADLARTCVDHAARGPTGEGKSFRIDIPEDFPALFVDPRLVRQALRHILSNAAKFTGPGGTIVLSARAALEGATIEIRDDGIGVEKQHLARLTEAFYQVDARLGRKYEGAGLGLNLVKRYMDLHQGSLAFESDPGEGLTVRLEFPPSVLRPDGLLSEPPKRAAAR